jgi:hypothetical protein
LPFLLKKRGFYPEEIGHRRYAARAQDRTMHNPGVRTPKRKRTRGSSFDFGLTRREASFLSRLKPPWRIQKFLDGLDYDVAGAGCRSARRVLAERRVQCMDGALFAAAALRVQGHPPLLLDLESVYDDDHVLAVFRQSGCWGAVARSNYSGLRFREPIFPTIRQLVLSYFESYFNLRRQKTLRSYSRPVNLSRFDRIAWMTTEEDLWEIPEYLATVPHIRLLPPRLEASLSPVDHRMFEAGLVGRAEPPPRHWR